MDFKELEDVKVKKLLIRHTLFKEHYQSLQTALKSEKFRNEGICDVDTRYIGPIKVVKTKSLVVMMNCKTLYIRLNDD